MRATEILALAEAFKTATEEITPSAGCLFYCPTDNTVFLTKRAPHMNVPNTWDITGGRPEDEDTSPLETATREVYEEIGVFPKGMKPTGEHVLKTKKHHYIVYIFNFSANEKKHFTDKVKLSEENVEYKWFDIDQLPQDTHFDLSWIPNELNHVV